MSFLLWNLEFEKIEKRDKHQSLQLESVCLVSWDKSVHRFWLLKFEGGLNLYCSFDCYWCCGLRHKQRRDSDDDVDGDIENRCWSIIKWSLRGFIYLMIKITLATQHSRVVLYSVNDGRCFIYSLFFFRSCLSLPLHLVLCIQSEIAVQTVDAVIVLKNSI